MTSANHDTLSNSPFILYTIGEAADILGVAIPTIRMYEREGLIIPHRKRSKHRRFSQTDIERIRGIRSMINQDKISIAGIRRMLSLIPCWTIKNCPPEDREQCAAFKQHDKPCWIVSGKSWDCRSELCRECLVYTEASSCETLKTTIAHCTLREALSVQPSVAGYKESEVVVQPAGNARTSNHGARTVGNNPAPCSHLRIV